MKLLLKKLFKMVIISDLKPRGNMEIDLSKGNISSQTIMQLQVRCCVGFIILEKWKHVNTNNLSYLVDITCENIIASINISILKIILIHLY